MSLRPHHQADSPSDSSQPQAVRVQVFGAVALYALARVVLILSAPDVLTMVDQATWKHADLAFDLNAGQLPSPTELAALAWNGFNFHQVAFIPYSLCFALFSLVLGSSYFSLHLFATGFGALGVAGWSLLLARCGPRHSAAAFAVEVSSCARRLVLSIGARNTKLNTSSTHSPHGAAGRRSRARI